MITGQSSKKHSYLAALTEDACRRRASHDRPTWLVDDAERPLGPGHRAYSEELVRIVARWTKVLITDKVVETVDSFAVSTKTATQPTTTTQPDKLEQTLSAAGLPGLPRHPAGGAAGDCDDCGGTDTRSIFLGRRGDLLTKCHTAGCPSGGKVTPLVRRMTSATTTAKAEPQPEPDTDAEVETKGGQGGPQVEAASRWLREQLCRGPRPLALVRALAADAGISDRTLDRARQAIRAGASGPNGSKMLSLPDVPPSTAPASTRDPGEFTSEIDAVDAILRRTN